MTSKKIKRRETTAIYCLDNMDSQGELDFEPWYQRNAVWTSKQKKLLIDSLQRGYDIPKIYLRSNVNVNGKDIYEVCDGQQRIKAILDYKNDEFKMPKHLNNVEVVEEIRNKKFSQLDTNTQNHFNGLTLDICYLEQGFSNADVEDMFLRLQNGSPLKAAEKRRALSTRSDMVSVVSKIAKHKIFGLYYQGNKRYAYDDAVAKALTIMLNGDYCSIGSSKIHDTYIEHDDIKVTDKIPVALKAAYNVMYDSFDKTMKINPELKKWSMITLPLVVNELLNEYAMNDYKNDIGQIFWDLERDRKENDNNPSDEVLTELTQTLRGDSYPTMTRRHEIVKHRILSKLPDLELKDPQRNFNQDQRVAIYYNSGPDFICRQEGCDVELSQDTFEADHIKPHSAGGKTTVANGQALCRSCNRKKGAL